MAIEVAQLEALRQHFEGMDADVSWELDTQEFTAALLEMVRAASG